MRVAPAATENLRTYGLVRGALIAYGVGAFTFLSERAAQPIEQFGTSGLLLISGLTLQLLLFAAHRLIKRYVSADVTPQALNVIELIGDGVTVLLFALATLGGIAQFTGGV